MSDRSRDVAGDPTLAAGLPPPTETAATPPPVLLGGRYEILGLVGSGGMGTVYRARDRELDEVVALKMLRRELCDAPGMLARFRQEAKLARRVTHRNVARIYDIGEHQTGDGASEKFLTMEYVDGESLAARLARRGAPPLAEAAATLAALCAGVAAAHGAGVVHRDLKPDNVLCASDGRVVITDFGIARAALEGGATQTLGAVVGTPAYMAPEQVTGAPDVDSRADLYSLGCIAFELLTGQRAWPGDNAMAVAVARVQGPPPDPRVRRPDLPDPFAELVLRLLARRREDRFPDAAAAEEAIHAALASISMPRLATPGPAASTGSTAPTPALPGADTGAGEKSVAVLPFRNLGVADEAYVAEGVTEDLIDTLSMTRHLRVRPRGAVDKALAERGADARDVGRALGVEVVVEGSVRKVGETMRLAARVIGVADGFQLWARRFDRPAADLLGTIDEAARAIADALTVDLGARSREAVADPVAIDLYLRARHELRNQWYRGPRHAIDLLEAALARAPDDPTILAAYASARSRLPGQSDAELQIARAAAERAIALAPQHGDSWVALANVLLNADDPAGAGRAARSALARAPGHGSAHEIVGRLMLEAGDMDEALRRIETALALDPTLTAARWDHVRGYALKGDWKRAEELMGVLPADPQARFGQLIQLARLSLWRPGDLEVPELPEPADADPGPLRFARLCRAVKRTRALTVEQREFVDYMANTPEFGRRARPFLHQLRAEVLAYVGEHERALDAVAAGVAAGLFDLRWMERCPVIAALRTHPRWPELERRVAERARTVREALGA